MPAAVRTPHLRAGRRADGRAPGRGRRRRPRPRRARGRRASSASGFVVVGPLADGAARRNGVPSSPSVRAVSENTSSAVAYSSGSASANSAQSDHSTTTPSSASRSARHSSSASQCGRNHSGSENACSHKRKKAVLSSTSLPSRTTQRRPRPTTASSSTDGETSYVQRGDASRGGEVVRPRQSHGAMTSRKLCVVVLASRTASRRSRPRSSARPCSLDPGVGTVYSW